MSRLESMTSEFHHGRSVRDYWLDLRREIRSSFGAFADVLPPAFAEERGIRRVWLFSRAMFFRLSPVRRVILAFAFVLLASMFFISGEPDPYVAANRLVLSLACVLIVLALELADRVTLKRDLEMAREIQRSLLPSQPPQLPGLEIAFGTRPANTVAGDYYDVLPDSEGGVLFVMVDVAGKGIPAGLLMTGIRSCLHTLAAETTDVGILAKSLHRRCFQDSSDGRHFATAFLAKYDPASRSLSYVNAGHNPAIVRRSSASLEPLETGGLPLGMFSDARYQVGHTSVAPGDFLLIYTDGLVEALNEAGEEYGAARLSRFISETHCPPAAFQQRLFAEIDTFTSVARQHDDMTCFVVEFSA